MAEEKEKNAPRPMPPMRGGRGMPVPKGAINKGTLPRLFKTLFKHYKLRLLFALACIVLTSSGNLVSSIF